jgi:hypothetical protein
VARGGPIIRIARRMIRCTQQQQQISQPPIPDSPSIGRRRFTEKSSTPMPMQARGQIGSSSTAVPTVGTAAAAAHTCTQQAACSLLAPGRAGSV